jgi:hypothetical protein
MTMIVVTKCQKPTSGQWVEQANSICFEVGGGASRACFIVIGSVNSQFDTSNLFRLVESKIQIGWATSRASPMWPVGHALEVADLCAVELSFNDFPQTSASPTLRSGTYTLRCKISVCAGVPAQRA